MIILSLTSTSIYCKVVHVYSLVAGGELGVSSSVVEDELTTSREEVHQYKLIIQWEISGSYKSIVLVDSLNLLAS